MSENTTITDQEAAEMQARLDAYNQAKMAEKNEAEQARRAARAAEISDVKSYVEGEDYASFRARMADLLEAHPNDALAIHFQAIIGSLDRIKRTVSEQT